MILSEQTKNNCFKVVQDLHSKRKSCPKEYFTNDQRISKGKIGKFTNHKIHKETNHKRAMAQKSTNDRIRLMEIPEIHNSKVKLQVEK